MTKIRVKLETSVTRTAEHKIFLKKFDLKNISTSKTKQGNKFFCFTVKSAISLAELKRECADKNYNLIVE